MCCYWSCLLRVMMKWLITGHYKSDAKYKRLEICFINDRYLDIIINAVAMFLQSKVVESQGDSPALGHGDSPATYPTVRVQVGVVWRCDGPRGGIKIPSTFWWNNVNKDKDSVFNTRHGVMTSTNLPHWLQTRDWIRLPSRCRHWRTWRKRNCRPYPPAPADRFRSAVPAGDLKNRNTVRM